MSKFLKQCWVFLAILIIVAGLVSSLFRALTPWAKQYKTEVEQHLSVLIGEKVSINTMETGWYWFEPVIKLNQISISDGKKELIKLNKLLMGINLFSSLWHWQIQPGILFIDDLHLSLHQTADSWQIDGVASNQERLIFDSDSYTAALAWILAQQKIIVKNLSAKLYLLNGSLIPLNELNLKVVNHRGYYQFRGEGQLDQTIATAFQLFADVTIDAYALQKSKGRAYFSVKNFAPAQWQDFIPQSPIQLVDGVGNAKLWVDIAKGRLASAQAQLQFRQLAWSDKNQGKNQVIPFAKANLAWSATKDGWELAGDRLQLRLADTRWPENSFLIRYQRDKQDYFIFIKTMLIDSLLSTALPWPKIMAPLLAIKPHGQLHESQFHSDGKTITSLLTGFSQLGWSSKEKSPALDNLSGVLHWQPTNGRLAFDSKAMKLKLKNKRTIDFEKFNAAFSWKKSGDNWQINTENFLLSRADLALQAMGFYDDFSLNKTGTLRMKANFSAKNAKKWLAYLPEKKLKPKFEAWLRHDVKRIDELKGQAVLEGALSDFPFDKKPGEFSINTHFTGVNLFFAPHWPLTSDIDGYIHINKRTFEADIEHANLQGIKTNQGHLLIKNLGLDHETLLIHSKVDTTATKAMTYVESSPLNKKLSALQILKIKGPLALDLHLEAPLYPENDEILALGNLSFKNNTVNVHHSLDDVELNALTGSLVFNQEGILDSNLNTIILGFPASLLIKSIHTTKKPYTEVKITGETSAAALAKKFNLPIFSLLHGTLGLESTLTLSSLGDLKRIQILSSLEGLKIDLPPPLGKLATVNAPLSIDINLNSQKDMRVGLNYDNRLCSDLWLSSTKTAFTLERGELQVGSVKSLPQKKLKGLQVLGSLTHFDLQQWLAIKEKLTTPSTNKSFVELISLIDIKLDEAKLWNRGFKDLAIKATQLTKGEWAIALKQPSVIANLHYQFLTNSLSGQVDKLNLANSNDSRELTTASDSSLTPLDIPNLDLRVSSLFFGKFDLGELSLKTTSSNKRWQLNSCKLKTDAYQLSATGDWKQENNTNATNIKADLHITDLANSLRRIKVSPVVEAHRGDLRFEGGWPGRLCDFSLAKTKGQMVMNFNDGRITHLSPETEEKLGLGKLLSILSLQTIPRRLKLDFSDLSQDGYSFDEFKGSFELLNGVLITQDSSINGPVAYASMKGQLDLVKQSYDVDLRISPHITASLPIVATIAGGPIAGLATWIAAKIINHGMQKISGYTYKVSGPWQNPVVEQVSIIKKAKVASKF